MDHLPFWHFPAKSAGQGYGEGVADIIEWMAMLKPSNWTKEYGWMDPDFLMTRCLHQCLCCMFYWGPLDLSFFIAFRVFLLTESPPQHKVSHDGCGEFDHGVLLLVALVRPSHGEHCLYFVFTVPSCLRVNMLFTYARFKVSTDVRSLSEDKKRILLNPEAAPAPNYSP